MRRPLRSIAATVLVLLLTGLGGCDRASPSCDALLYGDLPCL